MKQQLNSDMKQLNSDMKQLNSDMNQLNINKKYIITRINDFSYSLKILGEYKKPLYSSFIKTNILTNAFYDDELYFNCEKVETMKEYLNAKGILTEKECVKILKTISKQIKYLELTNYAFYGYDLDDLIVINESIFLVASAKYLLPIIESNIVFDSPISLPYFASPEMFKLTKLPSEINYKTSYYSLGALIVFCLLNN